MSQSGTPQGIIHFGGFDADLRSAELRKRGIRIKLQIQPFQVLQILIEHAGEVVTREELQKRIWPVDTFVDFDQGLNNAVKKLREALADDAEKPRFIETLSKRGYRFIAHVEELGNGTLAPAGLAPAIAVDSIAVLPFTSMSPDPENEFFADGITEEIINALAQIEQLHVVARSSAFSFKGKHIDARVVGEQLNVRTVLEGSVRRADNRLRITVQLVNTADGYHLWSERYDREMKDIFDVQDEIARSVAERLKITLEGVGQERLVKAGTKNLEAYQLCVKGRILLSRRTAVPRAVECFHRAVNLDPDYALAWAGLADSYTVLGYSGLAHPESSMPKGMEAARHAVALDPSLAEAHDALAMACLVGVWDKAEAERQFFRALELNPRHTQVRDRYAFFYLQCTVGRLEEAVAQAKLAVELDPLSSYAHAVVGFTCSGAGRHLEAVQACERAVKLDPESFLPCWCKHLALHLSGRFEEAIAVGELALAMSGRHPWAMASLATALADCGKTADAEAIYAELMGRARRSYVPPSQLALVAAAAGMKDEAISCAREALQIGDPSSLQFSKWWPYSGRLRADPRLHRIITSVGRSDWLQV